MSLESSSKLERVNHGARSHWWRGWPEGSEVFQPESIDARPGNHKTGENLSKPEPCDQKRCRKQLCQESFLLPAGALSFWHSLSQLPEQMLSPKEPLPKHFLTLLWPGPTGGWKWVAFSFPLIASFFWQRLLSDCTLDFSETIGYWLFTLCQLTVVWCSGPVQKNQILKLLSIPGSPDQQIPIAWASTGMNFLYLLHHKHYPLSQDTLSFVPHNNSLTRNYIQIPVMDREHAWIQSQNNCVPVNSLFPWPE